MQKVICFGEALIDLLSNKIKGQTDEHESFTKYAGGAPANVSVALAKLGGHAYFAGMLGEDMFGRFILNTLKKEGVKTDYTFFTKQAKTGLAFVSLDDLGDRSFEFYRPPAADLCFTPEHFSADWFSDFGIFHFCSNSLTEDNIAKTTQTGISMARENNWLISFDVNLRTNLWAENVDPRQRIKQFIPQADVIKVAIEELDFIANGEDHKTTIDNILATGCQLVIVTDGPKTLTWYSHFTQQNLTPVKVTPVDSTAAGDAFVGGIIYQLSEVLNNRQSFKQWVADANKVNLALQFASRCGAYAAAHAGAFPSLPDKQSIQNYFKEEK
ncbi:carbohydrate kinase [Paraglaciecola sp. L3A3]|uniref:carbohydrate kinase family protein n=1 Tax=Paraglaciecola sp. L3A3 TaxID=2686358 RepID=UPI00131C46AB|nr:carbohydrate kinase [Paraglaciecola sp. L3A3]